MENDAIDFLRDKFDVPEDEMLVDAVGTNIKLDRVIRLLDEYANPHNPDLQKEVARQMYYSLCSELTDISKQHVGEKFDEIDEADRVQEIFALTELINKEYNLNLNNEEL